MEKKKGIKIRFTVAIIIIELVFLISMMTVYYIYHLADNKKKTKNSIYVSSSEEKKENIKIEKDINKDIEGTAKYEWEEYPNDDKRIDGRIADNVKKDSTACKLVRK